MTDERYCDFQSLIGTLMSSFVPHADLYTWIGKGKLLCSASYAGAATTASTPVADSTPTEAHKAAFNAFFSKWKDTFVPAADWAEWLGQFDWLCATRPQSAAPHALTEKVSTPSEEKTHLNEVVKVEKDYRPLPPLIELVNENNSNTNNCLKRVLQAKVAKKWYDGLITNLYKQLEPTREMCEKFRNLFMLFQQLNITMGRIKNNFSETEGVFEKVKQVLSKLGDWVQKMQQEIDTKRASNYELQCACLKQLKEEFMAFTSKTLKEFQVLMFSRQIVECLRTSSKQAAKDFNAVCELVKEGVFESKERPPKRASSKSPHPHERLKRIKRIKDDEETELE